MRDLDDYFFQAGQTLYHYTGVGALLGIVESRSLFATHAYYLNDAQEITYASGRLMEALVGYENCRNDEERAFLSQFADWLQSFRQTAFSIFIFSLSEEQSLLSQWRSYTPHGKGVSLGFSPIFLNAMVSENGCRLAKCIYEHREQGLLVSALIDKMFITLRQWQPVLDLKNEHQPTRYHKFLEDFRGDLLQVLAIIKHPSFSEEREWRVVSKYYPSGKSPSLRFREGPSMLIPHIAIPFPVEHLQQKMFDKVVLGPSRDQNLAMESLGGYLTKEGVCDVRLNCGIPYRKW